jgi:enoyl-[acyl-carrier protein] reductase III
MIDLTGKVALVTGASRGIGRAIAVRLAEAGADVVLNFVSSRAAADRTAETIAALGRRVAVVQADVSEPDDVESMMEFVGETFGRLDILVSNAATAEYRPILDTTPEQFATAMNTNVRALLTLVRAARPLLTKGEGRSKVVGLSNYASQYALPNFGLVGATKAALESALRHMARELGPEGINFNIVQAGLVETDSTRKAPGFDRVFEQHVERVLTGGRMLEATDVANAVLFLASPLSDLVQGQTLVVDAGAAVAA